MKKILPILIAALLAWRYGIPTQNPPSPSSSATTSAARQAAPADFERVLQQAYQNRQSNIQIEGQGIVAKILPDDTEGTRHQRFLLKLTTGQTLLVAHNTDLAPRIDSLKTGDTVRFYGEYEWNRQGGVIHWTHRDPGGRHADGWLELRGRRYQ